MTVKVDMKKETSEIVLIELHILQRRKENEFRSIRELTQILLIENRLALSLQPFL